VTCYTGSTIISIGSTIVWLLSLVTAIAASRKDKNIINDNLMIVIINAIAWATVILNVGYPIWPPFAFVLLMLLFLVELLYDLNALAQ